MGKMTDLGRVVEFCRQHDLNMIARELDTVFSNPMNGLRPVLENLDDHLAYQIKPQNDGVMFAARPLASEDGWDYLGNGIFVYHAESMDHAVQVAVSDPGHGGGQAVSRASLAA